AKNLSTGEVKQLPQTVTGRIKGATAFSLARWAIPEWCQYQGRAIYCDSDQIAMQDIAELWNYELGESVIAAVPVKQAKCYKHYVADSMGVFLHTEETFYLASVMLMDCAKIQWSLSELVDLIDRTVFSSSNLMYLGEQFRQHFKLNVSALPSEWNHLDYVDRDSKIVHFTDLTSQPWRFHHNPVSDVWETVFLAAIDEKALTQAEIDTAYQKGWIIRRIKVLAQLPRSIRRPVNWSWRTAGALMHHAKTMIHQQARRLKAGLFRLTHWRTIRA
ncbi:hypothetical protein IQ250_16190, partial [Pseudanabaenaceae cyanobacterium LEGE 13415]|nr:hypothetical protein [Pseudanabaenaceae cyanobacterium LEGE 13415]